MAQKIQPKMIRLTSAITFANDCYSIFITNIKMVNAGMGAKNRGWHHFSIGSDTYTWYAEHEDHERDDDRYPLVIFDLVTSDILWVTAMSQQSRLVWYVVSVFDL